jgi:transposase-like protein
MAGTSGARRFTNEDKARAYVTLAANEGNIKRTARETDIPPATLRRWRAQWEREGPPSQEETEQAAGDFVSTMSSVRDKALALLEKRIDSGDINAAQLITAVGVLDDKITRAQGLPDRRVEHPNLPPPEQIAELLGTAVSKAIQMAENRERELEIIEDAEVIERRPALPSAE